MTSTLTATAVGTPEPPEEDIEALLDLDDEEFALVVSDALFYAAGPVETEPDWQCLFHGEIIKRTYSTLLNIKVILERKLSTLKKTRTNPAALSVEKRRWEAIEQRFKQAKTFLPASAVVRDRHVELMEREAKDARAAVRLLAIAIQRHRLTAVSAGLEPEQADRELWSVLDEVQLPRGGRLSSLTEFLGSGAWTDEKS